MELRVNMELTELKNDKAKVMQKQIESTGSKKAKIYNLNTGCNVIYSITNGREFISVSNFDRPPSFEELEFIRINLMKKDIEVETTPPKARSYFDMTTYTARMLEINREAI